MSDSAIGNGLKCTLTALALMGAACSHVPAPPATAANDRALAPRVDALLAARHAAHEFSGAVVMTRRGQEVYARGLGMANHAAGVAFTPDTPADGGSLAKTFTAAGVWRLALQGRLDLDAPVTRYLPDYPHAATTVRHLIAHSNGLPPYYEFFDPFFGKDEVRTTDALLRVVAREQPAPRFAPGTRFEYSNLGFDAAARVIERVSGTDYASYVQANDFVPLGMSASFARPARLADWRGMRTLGYRWRDGAWQVFDVGDNEAFLGASNLYFSARDLSRWAAAHAAGTVHTPDAFAAGQARPVIDGRPSLITGLSWYCDDAGVRCYYTGSYNAFHSLVYWDRARNESVAMTTNSSMPPWSVITLQRALVAALAGHTVAEETAPAFMPVNRAARATLAGSYAAPSLGRITVTTRADGPRTQVSLRVGDGLTFDAFQVSREVFYVPGPDYWIAFSGNANGAPQVLHLRSMFVDTRAARATQ